MREYDVVIVGAGPAGLFAAYELSKEKDIKVLLVDKGKLASKRHCPVSNGSECKNCKPCHIMCGYGGAGTFSDGKLNFIPKLGKTDLYQFMSKTEAQELVDYSEEIFNKFDMDSEVFPSDLTEANKVKEKAVQEGLDLLLIKQKHLGSDNLPTYIQNFTNYLEENGIEIWDGREVLDIELSDVYTDYERMRDICSFKLEIKRDSKKWGKYNENGGHLVDRDIIKTKKLILAPGRVGSDWIQKIADKLNIKYSARSIEVGVRVEVRNEIMSKLTDVIYDPTFFVKTPTYYDECRTFCTNPGGFVTKENYGDYICVNGHALKSTKSNNTNFAFISKIDLTEPVSNTRAFGKSIGKLACTLGDGKPIIQRLGDLKRGQRSTWSRIDRGFIEPTLKECVPGDIALVLPHRTVTNVIEGLKKLNKVVPGVYNDETLLYAPEIKFFSIQINTNEYFETYDIQNLYTIGDGAGNSGNIVSAACVGIRAAQNIKEKIKCMN